MRVICSAGDGELIIFEDGDYWVVVEREKELDRILKTENPYYPMSMVTKFDYDPIDVERLEELCKEWEEENG